MESENGMFQQGPTKPSWNVSITVYPDIQTPMLIEITLPQSYSISY